MEPLGPQKAYFRVHSIHCHGPICFAVREAEEVLSLQKSGGHGREMSFNIILIYIDVYVCVGVCMVCQTLL